MAHTKDWAQPIDWTEERLAQRADLAAMKAQERGDEWRQHAACAGTGTTPEGSRFWHPIKGESTTEQKRICNELCTVREECLNDALATGVTHGIRGGLSVRQRRALSRKAEAPHGTRAGRDQHLIRGEKPCEECRAFYETFKREYRDQRRSEREVAA